MYLRKHNLFWDLFGRPFYISCSLTGYVSLLPVPSESLISSTSSFLVIDLTTPPDPRVAAGVVVIGCPDYIRLMTQRAGEQDRLVRLPPAFLDLVSKLDPTVENVSKKDVLILKGDDDPLVPWSASEPFVSSLPKERAEVVGYPGVGHAFPKEMLEKAAGWIVEWRRRR